MSLAEWLHCAQPNRRQLIWYSGAGSTDVTLTRAMVTMGVRAKPWGGVAMGGWGLEGE